MSITNQGIDGEKEARNILKGIGLNIFGGDWIGEFCGHYYVFEIKHKERYVNPDGHGTDLRQLISRNQFTYKTGIPTILLVIEQPTNQVFWNYFSTLNNLPHILTRNKVCIWELHHFKGIEELKRDIYGIQDKVYI